jgi:hypothetical protein
MYERYGVEGNFGLKITGSRSKVKGHIDTNVSRGTPLSPIHPPTKYQPKIFIRFEDTERKGIIMQFCVKVTGSRSKVASTQIFRYTPLSPDTSSHQISTKNLHSLRRYRAERNFGFKVTGSRSKVTSTRFFLSRDTPLFPDTSSH